MASIAATFDCQQPTPTPVLELPRASGGPVSSNRRYVPRLNAKFTVCPADGGPAYHGIDISFGGLMCSGGELTWPGNLLEVDVHLPGEKAPVQLAVRVVELVPYRGQVAMRMRFEEASLGNRKRIAAWMARRAEL